MQNAEDNYPKTFWIDNKMYIKTGEDAPLQCKLPTFAELQDAVITEKIQWEIALKIAYFKDTYFGPPATRG